MNNEKINSFSLSTIIISLCSSAFYGTFSSYVISKVKTDAFICIIIGFIISIFFSKIILYIFNKNINLTYVQKNKKVFPKIHNFIILIIMICSIAAYILLTYRLSSFLSTQYLIDTPDFIILIMVLLITYYISSKGIETLSRVSTITFYISIIIFIFDFISLFNQINYNNFLPLFTSSTKDILVTSLLFSLYFTIPLINLNAIKKSQITDIYNFNKYLYSMMILSFVIILLNMFTTIGVLGVNVCNLFDYPIYTTLKSIKLFSFLDSMENVSIMLWVLFIINACSMNYLFITNTINKKKYNFIILLLCFIIPKIIFKNGYVQTYNYILLPTVILIIILFIQIITIIKNRLHQSIFIVLILFALFCKNFSASSSSKSISVS